MKYFILLLLYIFNLPIFKKIETPFLKNGLHNSKEQFTIPRK